MRGGPTSGPEGSRTLGRDENRRLCTIQSHHRIFGEARRQWRCIFLAPRRRMTGGVVFMLPRSFAALRATERDSGVVNIIANEIPRVFDGAIGTIRADDGNGHRSEE